MSPGTFAASASHLYLFDVGAKKAEVLTPGGFDEEYPVWSPDGSQIAFVSKRGLAISIGRTTRTSTWSTRKSVRSHAS